MWYYDPFIVLPMTLATGAVISFIIMIILAKKRKQIAASIMAAFFSAFAAACGGSITLIWLFNNPEKAEAIIKWIGIM